MKKNPSDLVVAVCIACCALFAGFAAHAAKGTARSGGLSFAQLSDVPGAAAITARVIQVTAKRFEYAPSVIPVRWGDTITLSLRSADIPHGFNCPGLGLRAAITPGQKTQVRFVAAQPGTFPFFCDIFCGEGHEDMTGTIVIAP